MACKQEGIGFTPFPFLLTMDLIVSNFFLAIIILITVYGMIKVFSIAYKRKEISLRKFTIFTSSAIVIGLMNASVLPFGYQKILDIYSDIALKANLDLDLNWLLHFFMKKFLKCSFFSINKLLNIKF